MASISFAFILCVLIGRGYGIIHQLNGSEYARMPPIFQMDPFEECFFEPGGMYCTVDFTLVADSPIPLMDMIREYSEPSSKRFNHSKLTYGICVTKSCTNHNSTNLRLRLESCLNDTMWDEYGLKTIVPEKFYCEDGEKTMEVTPAGIVVAFIVMFLFLLNFIGSSYDFCCNPDKDRGIKFLLCFSIRRNWIKLVTPIADTPEPRFKRLKSFNGLKVISTCMVIFAHSIFIGAYFVNNTAFVEGEYNKLPYQIIFNGTIIVQNFFIVSGFLLAYNLQLYAEKHALDWKVIVKAIVLRWLRLTPAYAIVLGFVLTWYGQLGTGPIWQKVAGTEVTYCRETWWYHLFYLNNYLDGSECLSHTWYLAADTQLYILGVLVWVVCGSARSRLVVLSLLFVAGMVIPAVITYINDLDGAVIVSPEATRGFYVHDQTYIQVYSRGHTNIAGYVIGMALGYLIHYTQAADFNPQKYKKYRVCVWLTLPLGFIVVGAGKVFYADERASLAERVAAAALLKPIFGFLVAICLGSSVLKFENVYRGILEWRGWTPLSRVTYSAYLLHYVFVKYFIGNQVTLLHISFMFVSFIFMGTIFIGFLAAFPFYLLVESPLAQLIKLCLPVEREKTKEPEEWKQETITTYSSREHL
ncbi:nose resistant to fluoxetine protein 6 [Manduca sexta]|uniref:nose resistant to fluoxetine protein 6 n=1 Tax=Manduca sexta TaxID=7130 RepID=UPI00188E9D67|nr:nose resistant to fluoxetine protein 6 [Manduca sexta]